ncbi:response regulator transcription factor [Duganella sp. Root198D2]|uniref:response regulator transcription factor n=1 Tax=Duganella sp. Root198D2 TaxID=1736489 RepID=UPI0007096402|nr:LuxR C-terminal-related transcriptional regulator [Duganella sp. Root198D2]KRC02274.1 LuxR family transcriptional regulator [Duganella sp. Root198D2]
MTPPSNPPAALADNARNTRRQYRLGESSAARWRLLTDAAAILASDGARPKALSSVLAKALAFLSLEDGVLLETRDDGLHVCAAQGSVSPVGARIMPRYALAAATQHNQLAPVIGHGVSSALRISRDPQVGMEVLVPLHFDGKNRGVLGLLSAPPAPPPNPEDIATLQAAATLLAAAMAASRHTAARPVRPGLAEISEVLTPRELQVFALLPSGMTNAAMGEQLGIATGTVKVHVERILHKLALGDRTQAAVRAADYGFGA